MNFRRKLNAKDRIIDDLNDTITKLRIKIDKKLSDKDMEYRRKMDHLRYFHEHVMKSLRSRSSQ